MKSYLKAFLSSSQIHRVNVICQQSFKISIVVVSTELFFFAHKSHNSTIEGKWKEDFDVIIIRYDAACARLSTNTMSK